MIKLDFNNSAGLVFAVIVLLGALVFLRYHLILKEKFMEESLFNNKLTKEYEEKFNFRFDCSPPTFKKKMLNYFNLVKDYRQKEQEIYKLNDELKAKHEKYVQSMKDLKEAKIDLDYCVSTM